MVPLPLTAREIEVVMSWREETFWPDDARVLRKLEAARQAGESPQLSRLQIEIASQRRRRNAGTLCAVNFQAHKDPSGEGVRWPSIRRKSDG